MYGVMLEGEDRTSQLNEPPVNGIKEVEGLTGVLLRTTVWKYKPGSTPGVGSCQNRYVTTTSMA